MLAIVYFFAFFVGGGGVNIDKVHVVMWMTDNAAAHIWIKLFMS